MRDFNFTIVSKISQKYVKPCIELKKYYWVENSGEMGCTKKVGKEARICLQLSAPFTFFSPLVLLNAFLDQSFLIARY